MSTFVTPASTVRLATLLCCAAMLLSACGGNGGSGKDSGLATQTAAEVIDSRTARPDPAAEAQAQAAEAAAGTSADQTAGVPVAEPGQDQAAAGSAAPPLPPAQALGAAPAANPVSGGAARIYVASTAAPSAI